MKAEVSFVLPIRTCVFSTGTGCQRFFQVQLLFPEFSGNQEKSVFAEAY